MLALLVAGCSGRAEAGPDRSLGVIAFHGDPVVIEVPDTVPAGTPFDVSVRTYGDGCVTKGDTEVRQEGRTVNVRPYDVHSGAEICTLQLKMFDHRATVTLDDPGPAEIRFHGRELPADSVLTVARSLIVR